MEDFTKRIELNREHIRKYINGLEWLRSIEIKKKADGTDYIRKNQSCPAAVQDRWSSRWRIPAPEGIDIMYDCPAHHQASWDFIIEQGTGFTLEEDIKTAIKMTEAAIEGEKACIKRSLVLSGYYDILESVCGRYVDLILEAGEAIQKQIEAEHPEYADIGLGEHRHGVAESWIRDIIGKIG